MISLHRIANVFCNTRAQLRTLGVHVAELFLHKPRLEDAANAPQLIPDEESEEG